MTTRIDKLTSIQMGCLFRSRIESDSRGDIAIVQMKDIGDSSTLDVKNLAKISNHKVNSRHQLLQGDIVFKARGLVNSTAIISSSHDNMLLVAPLIRIRVNDTSVLLPEYLQWFLHQRRTQATLLSGSTGTMVRQISVKQLADLEIKLPSLSIQRSIAEMASLMAKEKHIRLTLMEKREAYLTALLDQHIENI